MVARTHLTRTVTPPGVVPSARGRTLWKKPRVFGWKVDRAREVWNFLDTLAPLVASLLASLVFLQTFRLIVFGALEVRSCALELGGSYSRFWWLLRFFHAVYSSPHTPKGELVSAFSSRRKAPRSFSVLADATGPRRMDSWDLHSGAAYRYVHKTAVLSVIVTAWQQRGEQPDSVHGIHDLCLHEPVIVFSIQASDHQTASMRTEASTKGQLDFFGRHKNLEMLLPGVTTSARKGALSLLRSESKDDSTA